MSDTKEALKGTPDAAAEGCAETEQKGGLLFLCSHLQSATVSLISLWRGRGSESLHETEMLSLYNRVENLLPEGPQKRLQFIGAHQGAGVSSIVRGFARVASERVGKSVLILDAAQHNPSQHLHLDAAEGASWIDVIHRGGCPDGACHQIGDSTLFLSPASEHPLMSLEQPAVENFLDGLRDSFHYILIDSSPAGSSPEALALSRLVDGVILVFEAEKTRWPVALALKEQAESSGGRVIGMVFNKRRLHIPELIYRRL